MIRSMTGFASETRNTGEYDIAVELKSLNSRYFEFKLKTSAFIDEWENDLKNTVYEKLKRGKIDLYIKIIEKEAKSYNIIVNRELAEKYEKAILDLSKDLSLTREITISDYLALGGIFQIERTNGFKELHRTLVEMTGSVTLKILDMMYMEGAKTRDDIETSLSLIETSLSEIETLYPENIDKFKKSLKERLIELMPMQSDDPFTDSRILMEVEIMSSRTAINEEVIRMKSHLIQFRNILEEKVPGDSKKMDFISQEMNRETNTISSKSVDYKIIENTILIKSEIEKIREQLRNLE